MVFDPFGDFDRQGYLRNFTQSKDLNLIKTLEHIAFQKNLGKAIKYLAQAHLIKYQDVLEIHKTLFGSVYPWAGQDRRKTAPNIEIAKDGLARMFAFANNVQRETELGLQQGQDLEFMRKKPGEVMGSLCHAHPFLDGNGRTIMIIHGEMAYRAGISIDWIQTDKTTYLTELTREIYLPGKGYLDEYLSQFVCEVADRQSAALMLKNLKGLSPLSD